jgi:hypothetical protein
MADNVNLGQQPAGTATAVLERHLLTAALNGSAHKHIAQSSEYVYKWFE